MIEVDYPFPWKCQMGLTNAIIIVLLIATLLSAIVIYRKLDARLLNLKESRSGVVNMHFRQIEALAALYYLLRPLRPLPSTRGWAASPDFLCVLADWILERRPLAIVECGSGTSTIVAARSAELNGHGHVYSLESDAAFAEKTRALLAQQGLSKWATVIDASLASAEFGEWRGEWYGIANVQFPAQIDLLVVDGPPVSTSQLARYPAVPAFFGALAEGGIILLDDADRPDEAATITLWMKRFPELQTVPTPACEKGCVALVRASGTSAARSA